LTQQIHCSADILHVHLSYTEGRKWIAVGLRIKCL